MLGWADGLDIAMMLALARRRHPWLTGIMRTASVAGAGWVEAPVALLVMAGLRRRGLAREARVYGGAALSGWAIYAVAKILVRRGRPHVIPHLMHDAGWYSYPSGHAALAPIVYGLATLLWAGGTSSRRARFVLAAAAMLTATTAFSRVYLGLHYPSDVAGGLLLGIGWSSLWLPRRPNPCELAARTEKDGGLQVSG